MNQASIRKVGNESANLHGFFVTAVDYFGSHGDDNEQENTDSALCLRAGGSPVLM